MNDKFSVSKKVIDASICQIAISGILDAQTAPILENEISQTINDNFLKIVVNFKDLDYISSAGLGVFIAFIEEVREKGGDIKLVEMSPKIYSVFELLGFPLVFDILPSNKDAISKFMNKS